MNREEAIQKQEELSNLIGGTIISRINPDTQIEIELVFIAPENFLSLGKKDVVAISQSDNHAGLLFPEPYEVFLIVSTDGGHNQFISSSELLSDYIIA